MEVGCENGKVEGWKHQASRDGLRGQEESEKGKERDHRAWKAAGEEEGLCQKLLST